MSEPVQYPVSALLQWVGVISLALGLLPLIESHPAVVVFVPLGVAVQIPKLSRPLESPRRMALVEYFVQSLLALLLALTMAIRGADWRWFFGETAAQFNLAAVVFFASSWALRSFAGAYGFPANRVLWSLLMAAWTLAFTT